MNSYCVLYLICALLNLWSGVADDPADRQMADQTSSDLIHVDPVALAGGPGEIVAARITILIEDGATLLSSSSDPESFTHLVLTDTPYFSAGPAILETGLPLQLEASAYVLQEHEHELTFNVAIGISDRAPTGLHRISAVLHYQACDDQRCFLMRKLAFEIVVEVSELPDCGCTPVKCSV